MEFGYRGTAGIKGLNLAAFYNKADSAFAYII